LVIVQYSADFQYFLVFSRCNALSADRADAGGQPPVFYLGGMRDIKEKLWQYSELGSSMANQGMATRRHNLSLNCRRRSISWSQPGQ